MTFVLGLIYLILCILNLIYNLFIERYESGFEAILVMGITAIGIYLSWYAMKSDLGKGK